MSSATAAAFTEKLKGFYADQILIPVGVSKPLITDPRHGYFSELILPPERAAEADVIMLGFPIDIGASYRMVPGIRPSGGSPSECNMGVRRGLGFCRTYAFPLEIDLKTSISVCDVGNIFVNNRDGYDEAFAKFSKVYSEILEIGAFPLVLGGDNSTSYITMKNFTEHATGKVGLIWLDAHTDTAMDYRGDRFWCGSPMARILELPSDKIDPANVVLFGIRGFDHSAAMVQVALDAGAHLIPAERAHEYGMLSVAQEILDIVQDGTTAFYVMWDPDVMEAITIPGHAVPTTGGIFPHQLKQLFRMAGLCGAGGFEVVEVAPGMDVRDMTIRLASESVLELISGLARCKADGVRTPAAAAELVRGLLEPRRNG